MMKFPAPERKKPKLAFSANISGAMGRLQEKEVNLRQIYIILLNPFLDVVLEGDGDAPTTEDEVSVEGSEVECEHVSGE